jgi:predicted NAD/FAD-dependent oxidoreductase
MPNGPDDMNEKDRELAPNSRRGGGRRLRVAVVGAGLSGLACARILADHGHRVRVFDKARGPGGRMSTRRAGGWQFDHGAQYFTVRDPRFEGWVDSWRRDGLVSTWSGRIAVVDGGRVRSKEDHTERLVAVPGMNAICGLLAEGLDLSFNTRIDGLERVAHQWHLNLGDGPDAGGFDVVVVSAPAPQAAVLLRSVAPELAARAAAVEMAPCWSVMAAFARPLDCGFDGAFVDHSALSWIARNASKPGRPDGETWVLHGSPAWSLEHLGLDGEEAAARLLQAFRNAIGGLDIDPIHLEAHRWRFALPVEPLDDSYLIDLEIGAVACGDWCSGPRVEGAFLSGFATADRVLSLQPVTG